MLVVTTNDLPGYRVVKHLGVVRGLTVRSRSVVGNIGAAVQIFFGGNITLYTKLAEQARQEAFDLLDRARPGDGRQCSSRHALRRQRDRLGGDGGAGLRDGGGGRTGPLIPPRDNFVTSK